MSFADHLLSIRSSIPTDIALVAVSKTVEATRLKDALATGHRLFAENYVQEAQEKWPALRRAYPDVSLRLIGHLQSNKAADAVALFDRIDTLDRPKLVRALAKEMEKQKRRVPLLIEVNIGGETQKHGAAIPDVPDLLNLARAAGLIVEGLMCIPPHSHDPVPYFKTCAALAQQLQLPTISMGMSADYKEAITCGSTEIRLGTALFGARDSCIDRP